MEPAIAHGPFDILRLMVDVHQFLAEIEELAQGGGVEGWHIATRWFDGDGAASAIIAAPQGLRLGDDGTLEHVAGLRIQPIAIRIERAGDQALADAIDGADNIALIGRTQRGRR